MRASGHPHLHPPPSRGRKLFDCASNLPSPGGRGDGEGGQQSLSASALAIVRDRLISPAGYGSKGKARAFLRPWFCGPSNLCGMVHHTRATEVLFLNLHYARGTCCDRVRGRMICSTKAHSRVIDSVPVRPCLVAGWRPKCGKPALHRGERSGSDALCSVDHPASGLTRLAQPAAGRFVHNAG
jgi:hypothetical protein